MTPEDARHMAHALALGRRGLGRMRPFAWPSVGCVLVRDGRVVGRGRTEAETVRHAERVALDQAGEAARGATAYVTLEPCAHHGNTPPCADALIAAGIARVVVAMGDPNPLVGGGGLERLRAAGVTVEVGLMAERAAADHVGFLTRLAHGRPMVTLKLATSLDGRIATATGESRWLTGPEARRAVHAMRARNDAVMVGAGTARADDPSLTVRDLGIGRQPVRVVLSRQLDLPADSALARTSADVPLWLCHSPTAPVERRAAWSERGATLVEVPERAGRLDPAASLQALGALGLTRVFCEGGGTLAAALLRHDLVDRLVTFTAGLALGADGTPAIGALDDGRLADAPRWRLTEVQRTGADIMMLWERA